MSCISKEQFKPTHPILSCLATVALIFAIGCETDSYMNPSVTGYYENTPTTMPVLDRIDVIEAPEEPLGVTGPPEAQDLIANTLQYRLAAGDEIGVEIYELITVGRTESALRIVDQGGYIRLPTINEVKAAGLTLEELREAIRVKLEAFIKNPVVTVDIQKGRSFEFTIQGAIQNAGIFALNKPNFRLTNAIALAGGADVVAERVLVVRAMSTEEDVESASKIDSAANSSSATPQTTDGSSGANPSNSGQITPPSTPSSPSGTTAAPVDIESLINKLSEGEPAPTPAPTPAPAPAPTPAPTPAPPPTPAPAPTPTPAPVPTSGSALEPVPGIEPESAPAPAPAPAPSPGAVSGTQTPPLVDIDTLEPISVTDAPKVNAQNATQQTPASQLSNEGDSFIFDVNSQQWVRIRGANIPKQTEIVSDQTKPTPTGTAITGEAAKLGDSSSANTKDPRAIFKTRIIEVDYDRLVRGDPSQNVVVRPGDEIFLQFPPIGVVYIDGEISRPGVFQLPSYGRLTLSRLVAAAGGLTEIAIPERVDLVRRLPGGREAAIRVNLGAIRNMSEPDIILKKDDHVIIGTNFWATPLAVFRNGLRITYGFGFLLDRNFGNDVFGPPPDNLSISR